MFKVLTFLFACGGLASGIGLATILSNYWVGRIGGGIKIEDSEYVRLTHQFVVPIVQGGEMQAIIMLSLGLEISASGRDTVFLREPKLNDILLRVMFDYANAGGFEGDFTESVRLGSLRRALLEAAQQVVGAEIKDVLISDVIYQGASMPPKSNSI